MKTLKITLSVLMLFMGPTIWAQDFSSWDIDNDGLLEKHEFTTKFMTEHFSAWSEGADPQGIVEEGFFKESYAGLDTDNDNKLSDEEWLIGYNYFYDDYLIDAETVFVDSDGDGFIDYDEYYDVIYNTSYFTDVDLDSDNYISEYELAEYVFNNWDFDDNGLISRYEFDSFKFYYLDV